MPTSGQQSNCATSFVGCISLQRTHASASEHPRGRDPSSRRDCLRSCLLSCERRANASGAWDRSSERLHFQDFGSCHHEPCRHRSCLSSRIDRTRRRVFDQSVTGATNRAYPGEHPEALDRIIAGRGDSCPAAKGSFPLRIKARSKNWPRFLRIETALYSSG